MPRISLVVLWDNEQIFTAGISNTGWVVEEGAETESGRVAIDRKITIRREKPDELCFNEHEHTRICAHVFIR
ncbi:hypothetical protein [Spirosoma utsteinense]|uniref:Uncharacterized protein n=1 Tax=Spirosoma utsteinense TaxID=2585773 RepID=A0ABR6W6A0_9BACT|nr:hypothetical protein [Spirosoma utsteinense]MBC3785599.1 hypothetical protein [Spirosoma utsteinense]MBC3791749.1 hypothetical protein [Spirosoma utsteinense]